jgi:short-subunit dehydrogenase
VVVTGGSKGIGRALVELFSGQGYQVLTVARHIDDLTSMNNVAAFRADLSKKKGVLDFCKWVKEKTKVVDVLINNVGIYIPGSVAEEEDVVFEKQMAINLNCSYYTCKGILPLMDGSEKSHIFNICSTASIQPYPNGASYCISKYAQYGLTKVLREELKERRIKVTAVLPGATYTDSWEGTDLPLSRFIQPQTVAQLIWASYQVADFSVTEEILVRPLEGDIP